MFLRTALISQTLLDNILEPLTIREPLILRQKEPHRIIEPVLRVIGAMRRDQHILQLVNGIAGRDRLLLENIKPRAPDSLLTKSANHRRLVDHRTPSNIDDHGI